MRRENGTAQESPSPRLVYPLEPKNKGKRRAELSSSPCHKEDRDLPVTGPDDYNGALSGESDQGEDSQSDGESASPLPPSSPIKKTRSKLKKYVRISAIDIVDDSVFSLSSSRPGRVGVSTVLEEPSQPLASSSHEQHSPEHSPTATHPSAHPASKASSSARKLAIVPLQLSQEPTPPHSSALDSPGSPLPHEHPHTASTPPQSGTARKLQRVAPLKQRRSHVVVDEEEDDIFCTPPIQSPPSSPPPRAHARAAPRLVEGPYRSAYTRANGSHRHASRGRHASRVPKGVEANSNEWPPRRGIPDASMSSPERTPPAADIDRASVQHIDLRVLHSRKSVEGFRAGSNSSFGSTSRTLEKKKIRPPQAKTKRAPRSSATPNLSEANKELVLALGLEEVYKRMAENHKFHVDIVREVAARQRSLEQADDVLRSMREAAEHEYARLLKRDSGVALGTGAHRSEESDEEEEEEEEEVEEEVDEMEEEDAEEYTENVGNEEYGHSAPSPLASPRSNHSLPELSMTNGGYMDGDADAMEVDDVPANQADSSLSGSQASPNEEWADDDDELLLDGDLAVHEELVRRKGLGSVKFRTAHLYSLLLDG